MIQDIAPHKYDNQYKKKRPSKSDYAIYCEDGTILVRKENDEITFPTFAELERQYPGIYEEATYLFAVDEINFFLVKGVSCAGVWEMLKIRELRTVEPIHLAFAGVTAYQLYTWYESTKFCGKCGSHMQHDDKERMMRCTHCGQMEYPKISPAVIVAVTDGNRLLLSKYAGREYKKYALIAGFAEIGESIEDTVRREVMEEVGLKVKNLRFYKSQPWSFTGTLLFGFFAELDGSREITLEEDELSMAAWFEREEIPVTPSRASLTNEMIMKFKNS